MVYCHYEPGNFPDTEFYRDKRGWLIHKKEPLHYDTGATVIPPNLPPLPVKIQPLLKQAVEDPSVMKDEHIQKLLDHIRKKP